MNKKPEELAEDFIRDEPLMQYVELNTDENGERYVVVDIPRLKTRLAEIFLAGYEAGRSKWISVKERLPEKETMVLTYSTDKSCRWGKIAFYGRWEVERDGMEWTEDVTHWMPLPALPCEGEK